MKAINAFGAKDVRLVEAPDPIPGEGEVLLKVRASGICGSDKWLWRCPDPVTAIQGHEVMGEVIGLGPHVIHLKMGDRVAVNNVGGCGSCPACRAGAFILCPHWNGSRDVNGGFGELVKAPERNCLKLDERIDDITGALIFDNLGTPFSAVERAEIVNGDDVVVMGCGPIGLGAVMWAKLRGAFVIAVDPLPYRRDFACRLGADLALPADETTPAAVKDATSGSGARVALECSGKAPSYPIAIETLRHGGNLIVVGEGGQWDFHPSDRVIRRHLGVLGSWYSSMFQGQQIQDLLLQKVLDPHILVTHTAPLAEFPSLFRQVCEFGDNVIKAVIVNPA